MCDFVVEGGSSCHCTRIRCLDPLQTSQTIFLSMVNEFVTDLSGKDAALKRPSSGYCASLCMHSKCTLKLPARGPVKVECAHRNWLTLLFILCPYFNHSHYLTVLYSHSALQKPLLIF